MKIFAILLLLLSFNGAYAFHEVSGVLSSGKLLICQDVDQIKKGSVVEQYSNEDHPSRFIKKSIKTSEFAIPAVGQQLVLSRTKLEVAGRMKKDLISEKIGTAIVSDVSIEGEERVENQFTSSRYFKFSKKIIKISKQEESEIKEKCIIAIPENGLKLNEHANVSW